MHTHTYTHTHAHMHTDTDTHTHTHTHAHTHTERTGELASSQPQNKGQTLRLRRRFVSEVFFW